jgi:glycosyltransferase 2 family protein
MIHTHGKRIWLALKTALAVAIVFFVAYQFYQILNRSDFDAIPFTLRFELLVPAALLYLLAHCCWATFWMRLMHGQGIRVSWYVGMRAYFVSQFGKYVPGKVWVILIRMDMLRHEAHAHPLPVAVTATFETLSSMAAGAFLGFLMLPYLGVLPPEFSGTTIAFVAVAALPVGLGVLSKLAARVVAKRRGPNARPLPAPSLFLLAQGLLHGALGHCLLGLSLALTVRAIAPEVAPLSVTYPVELGAVAICYVAGFVILVAPGGLGVREWVLQVLLAPWFVAALGPEHAASLAVIIALILRLVWTIAEVILALTLYFIHPRVVTPAFSPGHPAPGVSPGLSERHV